MPKLHNFVFKVVHMASSQAVMLLVVLPHFRWLKKQ